MDINYLIKLTKILLQGLTVSLKIFSLTLILAIPLAIIISVLSLSKNKIISILTKTYILIMRGTPLLFI